MSRVAVIGGGVVGLAAAIELLRDGHAVTIIEPGTPGGEQAASYGNGTLLNPSSVIPMSSPGLVEESPRLPDGPARAADDPLVLSAAPAALAEPLPAGRLDRRQSRRHRPSLAPRCWRTPPPCTANWPRKPASAT